MSAVDDLCRSYLDLRWFFDPAGASAAGLETYDGRLGRFDDDSVRQHLAALRSLSSAAEELEVEDLADEIDRTALLDEMRVRMFEFTHENPHRTNPVLWIGHIFEGLHAVLLRDGGTAVASRAPQLLERLKDVPPFLDVAKETLKSPPITFVDTALAMLGGGGELMVVVGERAGESAPELRADLGEATAKALVALRDFGRALGDTIAPSHEPLAFAVGEEQFNRRLRYEHALLAGAPELWRYGLHLRDEVEAQIVAVAHRITPNKPWQDVAAKVREQGAPDLSAVLPAYRDLIADARAFCEKHQLAELATTPVVMQPTPGFLQPITPFASYQPAPVYRPGEAARFFATIPVGPAPRAPHALEEHALPLLQSRVAHYTWPGHHLQVAGAQRLGREVRRHVMSPLTVDGWAQYAEDLAAEEGVYRDDAARLLWLVGLLWRVVRVDLDVGLHTRGLAPSEAVQELVTRVGMDRGSAEAEVRRYCMHPTYQLCAAVGRRELLQLRADVRAREGANFSLRRFHDNVLLFGGLPVPLIRWGLGLE